MMTILSGSALAQDLADCRTNYRTTSEVTEEFPGTLATSKNTGCRHTRRLSGKSRGSAPGRAAGFDVVQAPKNGKVTVESASTFIFLPKKDFAGKDSMLIRLKYMNGSSSLVRFAITVS
jgi:hypothetical protein